MELQKLISTFGLMVALSAGSSFATAADTAGGEAARVAPLVQDTASIGGDEASQAPSAAPAPAARYELSLEEMDNVSAGAISPFYSWLFDVCPDCVVSLIMDYGVNIYE
jgi:hypothetical protein